MNGLNGARRLARPVRLALTAPLGGDIDGAWWPHTGSIASELPELVGVLQESLGAVVDMQLNWSTTEGPLDFNTFTSSARKVNAVLGRRPRLMVVAGQTCHATLLVVPHMTSQQLGAVVMRRAVGMAPAQPARDTKLLDIADSVLDVARLESVRWAAARGNRRTAAGAAEIS